MIIFFVDAPSVFLVQSNFNLAYRCFPYPLFSDCVVFYPAYQRDLIRSLSQWYFVNAWISFTFFKIMFSPFGITHKFITNVIPLRSLSFFILVALGRDLFYIHIICYDSFIEKMINHCRGVSKGDCPD